MPNLRTIVVSGKKQSGKSTSCAFFAAYFLNRKTGTSDFSVTEEGILIANGLPVDSRYMNSIGVKVYSFADPLKRLCVEVFGVPEEGCYGTDIQKNTPIEHILWENLPTDLRPIIKEEASLSHRTGPMTGRELMQVLGTNFARKLYYDCWAKGTYSQIKREGYELALICDGRFPNEILLSNSVGAKTMRLLRNPCDDQHPSETALDTFDLNNYDKVIDNSSMSLDVQCAVLKPICEEWLSVCF
jgi:hypothetical protein